MVDFQRKLAEYEAFRGERTSKASNPYRDYRDEAVLMNDHRPRYRREVPDKTRWPVNWAAASRILHHAQIHLAEQSPEIINPISSHPDRKAVRILQALETLGDCTQ